jgi:glucosamine-6-phosphate deaminase
LLNVTFIYLCSTVMDAREVLVVITGAHKSIALAKCIEEGVNHIWTVSAIQMHPKGLIVCDEDATLELHVKVSNPGNRCT